MEVESPASGILLDVFFYEGDNVPVMTTIAAIGKPGEHVESLRPASATVQPSATPINAQAGLAHSEAPVAVSPRKSGISPRARTLAKQTGLNIAGISGTGPGGRIIERDVRAAMTMKPQMTPLARAMVEKGGFVAPPQGTGVSGRITTKDLHPVVPSPSVPQAGQRIEEEVQTIPVRGVRKIIAERMLSSMQTTAQLTLNASADARALLDYRKRLKNTSEALGLQNVTINHLILFAVSRTLVHHPQLNALFVGDTISQSRHVHLGFAVDTPRGLLAPVIRNADRLSLKQIAEEADRLAEAATDGTVSPDALQGGTFTVTNLGSLGIESFTPILNPPQVGILGVGNINLKPLEISGKIEFIPHMGLSLTVNHQVVDGAPAARFLQALSENLSQLEVLLAL